MTLPVAIRPRAQLAIAPAANYYDAVRPGYGTLFLLELERTLDIIVHWPDACALATQRLRRAPTRRFDDTVVYRPFPSFIRVVNVVPARRDPAIIAALDLS